MRITTPNGTLEGENVGKILKAHGSDCLRGADLSRADLRYADLRGDDQTVDMTLTAALRFSEKIGEKAYFVRTTAGKLRDADKKEARERDADEFMSRILKARIGGEA